MVDLRGYFGGRSPPKYPHFPLELRNSYNYKGDT